MAAKVRFPNVMACTCELRFLKLYNHNFYSQEPVKCKLGETTIQVCKNSNSFVKIEPNLVYDVPLVHHIILKLRNHKAIKIQVHEGHSKEG